MPEIHKLKYPNLAAHYSQGESVVFSKYEDSPQWPEMRKILEFFGTKSGVGVPLEVDGSGVDIFAMDKVLSEHVWPQDIIDNSKAIGQVILSAMRRREAEIELQDKYNEIKELKNRLKEENIYLQKQVKNSGNFEKIIGEGAAIKKTLFHVQQVAELDSSVLLLGETGTGKELIAHAVHDMSTRKDSPLVTVSCSALPSTLVESELFGREKGAFTGALTQQIGRFEIADGSTIFLDEIGDIPLETQVKLLRVLQEGQFERLGSSKTINVNVRIIAATNKDLLKAVQDGAFRQDLYYRLNVFPIHVPPLRDRKKDIPLLVWYFVKEFCKTMGKRIETVPSKTMETLQTYSWPGNVRELRNVIERGMILTQNTALVLDLPRLQEPEHLTAPSTSNLSELERKHIVDVLTRTRWRVSGKHGAAEILGLKESTLRSRMKKLGIKRL